MMRWAKKKQVTISLGGEPIYDYARLRTVCNHYNCEELAREQGLEKAPELTSVGSSRSSWGRGGNG